MKVDLSGGTTEFLATNLSRADFPKEDMLRDAEMEQMEQNSKKPYKQRMTINVNMAIGIMKEDLIRMALEDDPEKRGEIFEGIIEAMA